MTLLMVVESPNKVGKVQKCLGAGWRVVATVGHFRDLPSGDLGVDTSTWQASWVLDPNKKGVVERLREAAGRAEAIYVATDADREGEGIAWHVLNVLGPLGRSARRVTFEALTEPVIKAAVVNARALDGHLVAAQQARRMVDRVVGFGVSPLLRPFGPNHSAGRVQSAALHLVVEREKAREAFRAVPFWTLTAHYREGFFARWAQQTPAGTWEAARFSSQTEALAVEEEVRAAPHQVVHLETSPVEQKPKAPFTTSTLAQAASAELGFTPARTMALAQALFEAGAITYHRTDSVTLSAEAIAMAREWLGGHHPGCLPEVPVRYRNADAAQEAHEAIRPTSLVLEGDVKLEPDAELLFSLIARRFLASQCRPAVFEKTVVRIAAGRHGLLATGRVERFASFLAFLAEDEELAAARHEGEAHPREADDKKLPRLAVHQPVALERVDRQAAETTPPPRFTQATLVREMERTGIGRPSTYASTLQTLYSREYVAELKKSVIPTPRGRVIDSVLALAFPALVQAAFTAELEQHLDGIAGGQRNQLEVLSAWYRPFARQLDAAPASIGAWYSAHQQLVEEVSGAPKGTGKPCPRCGKELLLRQGAKGPFLACSGFAPKDAGCSYSADPSARASAQRCPKCAGAMEELDGRFGAWARCLSAACDGRLDAAASTQHRCPLCGTALKDKGAFLGCGAYPTCRFSVDTKAWERAMKKGTTCPQCAKPLVERRGKRGKFLACTGFPVCRHTEDAPTKAKASF
ncbi:MAG: type I DNA topoisomerase [Myxococcales bacterium]|nr:type I DNA topoisomerase [Myxococcales bacterium]